MQPGEESAWRRYEVALEWFTRALERERTAENLGNALSAMIRLGEQAEAEALLDRVRTWFPAHVSEALERRIETDDDLARLRPD